MRSLNICITIILTIVGLKASAQSAGEVPAKLPRTYYYLPDNTPIAESKLDSVYKAWGGMGMIKRIGSDSVVVTLQRPTAASRAASQKADEERRTKMLAMIGKAAPDFKLQDIDHVYHTLSSLKGKVVVLNFWFTQCSPCIQEMPELNQLRSRFKDATDVVFFALTFEKQAMVRSWLAGHQFDYTVLTDATSVNSSFGITTWPTNMIIDKQGTIRYAENYHPEAGHLISKKITELRGSIDHVKFLPGK